MPNWCTNIFSITGLKEDLECFEVRAFDGGFKFQNLCPMPEDEVTQKSESKDSYLRKFDLHMDSDTPEWYHWRIHNWGTKWDLGPESVYRVHEDPECLILEFDTAWSPPLQFVEKVCKMFPRLEFRLEYYELGNFFAGSSVFHDGMEVESLEGPPLEFEFSEDIATSLMEEDEDFRENAENLYNEKIEKELKEMGEDPQ